VEKEESYLLLLLFFCVKEIFNFQFFASLQFSTSPIIICRKQKKALFLSFSKLERFFHFFSFSPILPLAYVRDNSFLSSFRFIQHRIHTVSSNGEIKRRRYSFKLIERKKKKENEIVLGREKNGKKKFCSAFSIAFQYLFQEDVMNEVEN
jgi:hypothetical protein